MEDIIQRKGGKRGGEALYESGHNGRGIEMAW